MTTSNWITVRISFSPNRGARKQVSTAATLTVSWKMRNLRMDLNIVRPYRIAFSMDRKLSSRMVISPASFATSVPEPIAKPTSAFFSAGESFTPSPVMPTTRFSSCAQRTRRLLSVGSARDTTRRFGSTFFSSSSLSSASSALVRATSVLFFNSPASFAMATAVSLRSPVTITT